MTSTKRMCQGVWISADSNSPSQTRRARQSTWVGPNKCATLSRIQGSPQWTWLSLTTWTLSTRDRVEMPQERDRTCHSTRPIMLPCRAKMACLTGHNLLIRRGKICLPRRDRTSIQASDSWSCKTPSKTKIIKSCSSRKSVRLARALVGTQAWAMLAPPRMRSKVLDSHT